MFLILIKQRDDGDADAISAYSPEQMEDAGIQCDGTTIGCPLYSLYLHLQDTQPSDSYAIVRMENVDSVIESDYLDIAAENGDFVTGVRIPAII